MGLFSDKVPTVFVAGGASFAFNHNKYNFLKFDWYIN